jgi:hypothetical protein
MRHKPYRRSLFAVRVHERELPWQPSSKSARTNPASSGSTSRAANGEIIAASQAYDTKAGVEKGIESVRMNASAAKVVDMTQPQPAHN